MREQRTLFDLTQDGLVIGKKIQRIYSKFDGSAFVSDVRTEMEGQTIYNVTKAIGRVLRQHRPTRKCYRLSQRRLKPRQRVDYEKPLFPLPSLKQHEDGKVCLGWYRFEVEVNGDVLGGFNFEVTAPKNRKV